MAALLDIRTLSFVCGLVSLFLALPMIYTSLRHKTYPGFHLWTAAFVVSGAGMILLSLRGTLPDPVTVVLANGMLVAHLSMIAVGLQRFTRRPHPIWPESLAVMLTLGLLVLLCTYRPDVNLRIVVVSVVLAALYLRLGLLGAGPLARHLGSRNWLLILTCFTAALWFAARAALTGLTGGPIADFMAAGTRHGLTALAYILAGILIMTDLILVNSQQIEQELGAEENRYRLLFSQSPIGVVQIDGRGRIVELNAMFARIIGAPGDRLMGLDTLEAIENPGMIAAIRAALEGRTGAFEGEYTSVVSGRTSFVQVLTQGIHAADGSVTGAIGIFQDITDRKQAEHGLQHRQRLEGVLELAGAVCHEMNQPLMVIQGYADLIALDAGTVPPPLKEKLAKITDQVGRLQDTTRRLMGITRYKTKKHLGGEIFDIEKAADQQRLPALIERLQ